MDLPIGSIAVCFLRRQSAFQNTITSLHFTDAGLRTIKIKLKRLCADVEYGGKC
jgi:hypothetical protein